ncbi:MAG: T9SS type A sorting domain-containing protein [Chitinophagales bacterium]|nr:T9SS type A sorting domain-containing protein [Chitinophagales bacterium]
MDDAFTSLNKDEFVEQIAVDKINDQEEDVYMVGLSYSSPKDATYQYCDTSKNLGNGDAFLTKYSYNPADGNIKHKWNGKIKYSGSAGIDKPTKNVDRYDWAYCIAVDHQNTNTYVYVAGASLSSEQAMQCETCNGSSAFQPLPSDNFEGFIAKYDATDGSLLAYTYFGGPKGKDEVLDIAIKPGRDHDVYVAGYTESENLGFRALNTYDKKIGANGDGFIAGFDNCLTQLKYFTYYSIDSSKSADGQDRCHCLRFSNNGNELYVSGTSDQGTAGIATKNVYQRNPGGGSDAFVGKWKLKGAAYKPVWGTYIGGDSLDRGRKLAITDPKITGETYVYVTGWTLSDNLKLVPGSSVIQDKSAGGNDAFLVKLDGSTGMGIWATYFGGSEGDFPNGLNWFYSKKTGTQWVAMAGITSSPNTTGFIKGYHGKDKLKDNLSGLRDAFFATFNDQGNKVNLDYATYLGGSEDENFSLPDCGFNCNCLYNNAFSGYGSSVATLNDGGGTVYVSFSTNSPDVDDSLHGHAGGTIYNTGIPFICPDCPNCTHDNYDAFMVRMDMCSGKTCNDSRISTDQNSNITLHLTPNPFTDNISVDIFSDQNDIANVTVYDELMKVAFLKNISLVPGDNRLSLDFSSFPPGVYIASVKVSSQINQIKLVKQ